MDQNVSSLPVVKTNELLARLQEDTVILEKMKEKEVIFFLGKTKAGKTSTICSLAERKLVIREEEFSNVVDTIEPFEGFLIGHSFDSTTRKMNVCSLPGTTILLSDSCGFGDTTGITTDIGNALSLRNAVNVCLSFRLVIVIDSVLVRLGGSGQEFVNLLKILMQFFSPIEQVLPCMSFLFTRPSDETTSNSILEFLRRLKNADYLQGNSPLIGLIQDLHCYMTLNRNRCIIKRSDLLEATKREGMRDLLLQTTPFKGQSTLGCPLPEDAQRALEFKFQEIQVIIISCLTKRDYGLLYANIAELSLADSLLNLPFLKSFYEKSCQEIIDHISAISDAVSIGPSFGELIRSASVIQRYRDGRSNNLTEGITRIMTSLSNTIYQHLKCEVSTIDKSVGVALHQLAAINVHLSYTDVIPQSVFDTYGYLVMRKTLDDHVQSCDSRCSHVLDRLNYILNHTMISEEEYISLVKGLPLSPSLPPIGVGEQSIHSLVVDCMATFVKDLSLLKNAENFKEHLIVKVILAYSDRVKSLTDILLIAYDNFFGETGLLKVVESLDITREQCSYLRRIYSTLHALYSVGANKHFHEPKLCNLNEMVLTDSLLSAMSSPLALIDHSLSQQNFNSICRPLVILLEISLVGDEIIRTSVMSKATVVCVTLQDIREGRLKRLDNFQASDVRIVLQILKEASVLDANSFQILCEWLSNCGDYFSLC
jgi:hypothetical protein